MGGKRRSVGNSGQSMMHLVASDTTVTGPGVIQRILDGTKTDETIFRGRKSYSIA